MPGGSFGVTLKHKDGLEPTPGMTRVETSPQENPDRVLTVQLMPKGDELTLNGFVVTWFFSDDPNVDICNHCCAPGGCNYCMYCNRK